MPKPLSKSLFQKMLGYSKAGHSQQITLGNIDFRRNENLVHRLTEQLSKQYPAIPTFGQFQNFWKNVTPAYNPPKHGDPSFSPRPDQLAKFQSEEWSGKHDLLETTITENNYLDAKEKYDSRHRDYEKMAQRSRLVTQKHNPDFSGYRSFLCDPAFAGGNMAFPCSLPENDRAFFISGPTFRLREIDRQRHTYVTAGSGHGKSVTLERLIYHYATGDYRNDPSSKSCVILIDPHGDLAEAVARFKVPADNKDWLAYIKPALSSEITPTINPFDLASANWTDITLATDAFIEVFREIMKGDKDGTQFSPQMVTILKPCIATLLHMKNTSVADLIPFLSDQKTEYEPYINHGRRYLTNPSQIEFLKGDFFKDSYNPSKLSIKTKLRNLLADDYFSNFLCGPTTLNLEIAIRDRKVILFDLSDLTEAADSAIGRFVMATLTRFAFSQGNRPFAERVPIHLFVDECQDFISDSMKKIVTKTRKFRLYGTFAQQFCGQGMDTELKRAIIGNSHIKISGSNEINSLKTISVETGAPVEELQALETGYFHIKAGRAPSVAVKIPMVSQKHKLSNPDWAKRKAQQSKRYYRPIATLKAHRMDESSGENSYYKSARRRSPAHKLAN